MLADGTYDAFVVDVSGPTDARGVVLELTIVAGPHKGEVVGVRAAELADDPVSLIGLPATLTVVDGSPQVTIDR